MTGALVVGVDPAGGAHDACMLARELGALADAPLRLVEHEPLHDVVREPTRAGEDARSLRQFGLQLW